MQPAAVARARVRTQGLAEPWAVDPVAVVQWLAAVQAQELSLARWSVAQRTAAPSAAAVDAAMASGAILRTHVLRPTWHFVAREDLRWMLAVSAPHVLMRMRPWDRRAGLDDRQISAGIRRITRVLEQGPHATKATIARAFARTPVANQAWLIGHLLMHAELRGIVCSGAPSRGQHTYALVDERAPDASRFDGDAALAELAVRYLRSHGPATEVDFSWWSGLPLRLARRGIDAAGSRVRRIVSGATTWLDGGEAGAGVPRQTRDAATGSHVLQSFDELIVAYTDTRAVVDTSGRARAVDRQGLLSRSIVADGQVVARWGFVAAGGRRTVKVDPFRPLTTAQQRQVARAVGRFERFLGMAGTSEDAAPDAAPRRRRPAR